MSAHGGIYQYHGAMKFLSNLQHSFLSVHIHNTDFVSQRDVRAALVPNLHTGLLAQLTAMLYECNHYVRSFCAMGDWATPVNALNPCHMIIRSDSRPDFEHDRRYNGPSASEIVAIIPGTEDCIVGKLDIVIRRRAEQNAYNSERFDTIPVTHRSNDPLSYDIFRPHETDGWYLGLRIQSFCSSKRQSPRITPLMFYLNQRFQRSNQFNTIP